MGASRDSRIYAIHTQASFRRERFRSSQLNLHVRPDGSSSSVLIFVHGLAGSPYRTWGRFPNYVYDWTGHDRVDVAAFKYWTILRPVFRRSDSVDMAVTKLAQYLAELADEYDSIVLVGHSLGGVAAQAAAREYLEDLDDWPTLSKIAAFALFAPPRTGSRLARRILGWLVPAFRTLSAGSSYLEKLDRFLSRRIQTKDLAFSERGTVLIPTYVCYGTTDVAVNPLSARYSVDPRQCHPHMGGHLSCSKPAHSDAEQVVWLQRALRSVRDTRDQARRQVAHAESRRSFSAVPTSTLVTEFRGAYSASRWRRIYDSARRAATNADITVLDRSIAGNLPLDLLMAASHADAIVNEAPGEVEKLGTLHASGLRDPGLQVRVTPVGSEARAAVGKLESWLAGREPVYGLSIDPSADEQELESNLYGWIHDLLRSDPRRSVTSSSRVEDEINGVQDKDGLGGTSHGQ